MASPTTAFPLRFHDSRLRALVRELAQHASISQNEFIERAVEREVVFRGALIADELAAAADRLREVTNSQYRILLARSRAEFGEGEGRTEPLEAHALHGTRREVALRSESSDDPLGVLAAFDSAGR